jgi:hypothetical protein
MARKNSIKPTETKIKGILIKDLDEVDGYYTDILAGVKKGRVVVAKGLYYFIENLHNDLHSGERTVEAVVKKPILSNKPL